MYDALGKYYDALTDKEYYDRWYDYVYSLLHGRTVGIDVGCGSGAFTVELARRGKDIIGFDSSPRMLDRAFERAVKAGVKPRFACAEADKIELFKKVEFVTAMNDVVNYMKNPKPFFKRAARLLQTGGLLVFDISSEYKLREKIAGHTFVLESDETVCVWESSPVKSGCLEYNLRFFTRQANGLYGLESECQTQYIHPCEKITSALKECGFDTKVYGEFTRRRPKDDAQRIHFVAKKGSGNGQSN